MNSPHRWSALGCLVTIAMLLGNIGTANAFPANTIDFPQETDLVLSGSGITLKILAGSVASTLDINTTDFTVSVATGGTFNVRYPGPNPGTMINDGGLSSCVKTGDNNDITVTGPKTVTFTPAATPVCVRSGGSSSTTSITLSRPNGGEVMNAASTQDIYWSVTGSSVLGVSLSYSTDNGSTWTLITSGLVSRGFYSWTVPNVNTALAKVKIEADWLSVSDVSDNVFTIVGTSAPVVTPPVVTTPVPTETDTPTINIDKGLKAPADVVAKCESGMLIKGSLPSVYYCGADGRRYVFVSQSSFHSWYKDFSSVQTIFDADLALIPLGGNVTYKPGVRLIKLTTDPKVYAIARGGILRWVQTEAIAEALYGANWNKLVDDVQDTFFMDYRVGEPITP